MDLTTFQSPPLTLEVEGPLAHLSTNSKAAVEFEIRRQERIHWFLGMRQAELFIRDKLSALYTNREAERSYVRKIKAISREKDALGAKGVAASLDELARIEEIEDQIISAQRSWLDLQPLIRDADMELQVARDERDRIIYPHPEALGLSFDELQDRYAAPALLEKQAFYFAAEAWAAVNHLPASCGHMLMDLSPEQRQHLMTREAEIRTNLRIDEATIQAARRMMQLPPVQQQQFLQALSDQEQAIAG